MGRKVIPLGGRLETARRLLVASSTASPRKNNINTTATSSLFFRHLYSNKGTRTTNRYNNRLRTCLLSGSSSYFSTMSRNGGDAEVFPLSSSSVLKISEGDITKWSVDGTSDAIVNPANERMLGGGGADGAIHSAAGPELREACYKVPEVSRGVRCPTGEARITSGFNLPSAYVIHTVGPIYNVDRNPETLLGNAYRNSLTVAKDNNIKYIAFTAISCGVFGYPYKEAASVAISTVKEFANDFKEVHFVLLSDDIYGVWLKKAKDLLNGGWLKKAKQRNCSMEFG